jgi:hypothetical protein
MAKEFKMSKPDFLDFWRVSNKTDNPVTDAEETVVDRVRLLQSLTSDRTFPLETVELQSFNQKHSKNVEAATIHVGLGADEMARSMNSLAFVLADEIYFRSNKYNPTTEEGRKLLAHELTHVAQNENRENEGREELELEAEQAETAEAVQANPAEAITIGGETYYLTKPQQKKYAYLTAKYVINWLEEQKIILDEQDYLETIIYFRDKVSSSFPLWDAKTEAERWMSQEIKEELRSMAGIE